jgi:hypothetical protein
VQIRAFIHWAVFAAVLLLCPACEDTSGPDRVEISESLVPVLYWGCKSDAVDLPANQGVPCSYVALPVWAADSVLLACSATVRDGVVHQGIFEVHIDPATLGYRSFRPFDLGVILSIDYNVPSGLVLAVRFTRGGDLQLVRAVLTNQGLAVQDTLVGADRSPLVARFLSAPDEIVYYAVPDADPITAGFFLRDSERDSCIATCILSLDDSRGIAVHRSRRSVIYGVTDTSRPSDTFDLHVLGVDSGVDMVVMQEHGAFHGAAVNPVVPGEVAVMRSIREPGGLVESYLTLISLDTGTRRDVNMRTIPGDTWAIVNMDPSYSLDGRYIAFASSAFSWIGATRPESLWIYIR